MTGLKPVPATLVYCVRDGRVLLAKRKKPPYVGQWVAPGGKIEAGETPVTCAWRELKEETGLDARDPVLRGIVLERSPRPDFQWLLFCYLVRHVTGDVVSDEREGTLAWWPVTDLDTIDMPPGDRVFLPFVLAHSSRVFEATLDYDEALALKHFRLGAEDR
ncbi:MAG: NUDIX domain-containing protein [Geminicoccaceae bacterium]